MLKTLKLAALTLVTLLAFGAVPAMAEEATHPGSVAFSGAGVGVGLGVALTIVGAGLGMGRIAAAAVESMARQPEVAGRIQTAMIIVAAMLEGATLFALIVCIQLVAKATF